jgi:DNA-binding transcriptional LysR family regulator
MADLNLRRLRYFLALGEEPHFRRAAQKLHITQPVLSRQIRLLERELNVELVARDGNPVELTAAGLKLLRNGAAVVAAAAALADSVRDTRPDRVGLSFTCGISASPVLRALAVEHPGVDVRLVRTAPDEQIAPLVDGRVDLALVRSPVGPAGVRQRFLYAEPLFVVLPAAHRLAAAGPVRLAELADETLLQPSALVPAWCGAFAAFLPTDLGEKLEYVAAGRGVVILPLGAADDYRRDGLAYVPIADLPPSHVQLAWLDDAGGTFAEEAADVAVRAFAHLRAGV